MDRRKEAVLLALIKSHISSGQPVASSSLAGQAELKVSSATIRNDMAALEEEEYIIQPHTSAGRVPTEKAYRYYIERLGESRLSHGDQAMLDDAFLRPEENLKEVAKVMAYLSGQAVFWAFHRRDLYYTGVSNFLQQPEFAQLELVYNISKIIDRLDETVDNCFMDFDSLPSIMLGEENPFGRVCASVSAKYNSGVHQGLFGLLGPMRMDYGRNLALVKYVHRRLSDE